MTAQLFGGRHVERQTDEEEQQPPFQAPNRGQQGDEACQHEGKHDEHGTGYEGLLNGLVDEVDVTRNDGLGNVGQQGDQTLYLSGHPT